MTDLELIDRIQWELNEIEGLTKAEIKILKLCDKYLEERKNRHEK